MKIPPLQKGSTPTFLHTEFGNKFVEFYNAFANLEFLPKDAATLKFAGEKAIITFKTIGSTLQSSDGTIAITAVENGLTNLDIAQQGATVDQLLRWNGTQWIPAGSARWITVLSAVAEDGTPSFAQLKVVVLDDRAPVSHALQTFEDTCPDGIDIQVAGLDVTP